MSESRNISIEIKWALIFTVVQIIWFYGEKLFGLHGANIDLHPIYTNFFAIPAILMYYLALREKKAKSYGGTMSWKNGFISGMILTFGVAILSPIVQLLFHSFISPEYFENAIEFAENSDTIDATREQLESTFNLTNYLIITPISAFFAGLLTSLVIPLVTRK